ncbi:MAG: hypothetical protein V3R45_06035 [Candidatus Aminicenantaceae bacterium]
MKKYFAVSALGLILFSLVSAPGISQDAKKLLDKVINASGGRKVMEAIKDTTFSGTMDLVQMGINGTFTFYQKEPNLLRQELEFMGMTITSAFDGETGWSVNPETGATEDLPKQAQEDLKNEALGFGNSSMLFPEKLGITFADKGKEKVKGKEYLLLEMTFESGDISLIYIDPGTYLPYMMKSMIIGQMGIDVEQESIMGNYKKIDGLNFAHSVIIYQDGELFGSIVVDDVKFNTGLEDSFFKKK